VPSKKTYFAKSLETDEAPNLDRELTELYKVKAESQFHNNSGTQQIHTHQFIQTAELGFSATGSATVAQGVQFQEGYTKVLHAQANAQSDTVIAAVTALGTGSATITCRLVSGTANFSDAVTATVLVTFMVLGSKP